VLKPITLTPNYDNIYLQVLLLITNVIRYVYLPDHSGHWTEMILVLQVNTFLTAGITGKKDFLSRKYKMVIILKNSIGKDALL
jgi:hypothetical protein